MVKGALLQVRPCTGEEFELFLASAKGVPKRTAAGLITRTYGAYEGFAGNYLWRPDNSLKRIPDMKPTRFSRKYLHSKFERFHGRLALPESWDEFERFATPKEDYPFETQAIFGITCFEDDKEGELFGRIMLRKGIFGGDKYSLEGLSLVSHPEKLTLKQVPSIPF